MSPLDPVNPIGEAALSNSLISIVIYLSCGILYIYMKHFPMGQDAFANFTFKGIMQPHSLHVFSAVKCSHPLQILYLCS